MSRRLFSRLALMPRCAPLLLLSVLVGCGSTVGPPKANPLRWSRARGELLLRLPEGAEIQSLELFRGRRHWSAQLARATEEGVWQVVDGFGQPRDVPVRYPFFHDGHSFYALRRSGTELLVVDGQPVDKATWDELSLGPPAARVQVPGGCGQPVSAGGHSAWWCPHPRGAALFLDDRLVAVCDEIQGVFLSEQGRLASIATRAGRDFVVLDGAEGPGFDDIPASIALWPDSDGQNRAEPGLRFSPAGRVAYVVVHKGRRGVVLDGERLDPGADWVTDLGFAGERLFFVARQGSQERVVIDGKPGRAFSSISRHKRRGIRGERDGTVAYVGLDGDHVRLVVDNRVGPAFDRVDLEGMLLSAEGQAEAYVAEDEGGQRVVWRGQAGPRYSTVEALSLSTAGDHVAYTGFGQGAVVLKDHEPVGPGLHPTLSPSGEHLAWTREGSLYIDGVAGPRHERIWSPFFSAEREITYLALDQDEIRWHRILGE